MPLTAGPRIAALLGGAVGLVWLLACLALWGLQEHLIFFPDPRVLTATGPFRPVTIGPGLVALATPTASGGPTADGAVLLYLHGNGGNAADRAGLLRPLAEAGHGVLIAGYRGYGGNPGRPTQAGLEEDAETQLGWLRRAWPGRPVVLVGESLGTYLAMWLAAAHPDAVAGVVLDAPFTSLRELAGERFPLVPVRLLLRHPFDTLALAPRVAAPVRVLHGAGDGLIPPAMGARVAAAVPNPAGFTLVEGAGHPVGGQGGVMAMRQAIAAMLAGAPESDGAEGDGTGAHEVGGHEVGDHGTGARGPWQDHR
ncbi:alpha/beta fold hydrolase [Roseomonas sp. NAR14]|uniref:Alpha/beta fold hydrolase n=1 Tax=Roseomonas acroporae TaxID=2937791 RepID=A0A9X2BSN1_9PROT|nr:alpha/beta fold hydrolase [Roseomonas acroporae]MCK8783748.1 alpha/beta fold hydrolase [Roseomonas acroporae]